MRALAPPDVALIKQLEQSARANPAAYRAKVGLLSAAGNVALTVINWVPFAVPIIVILLFYSHPYTWGVALFALALLFWVTRPKEEDTGRALTREEAPDLYAAIDTLRESLNVPREMRVVLTDDFNASALEMPGLLGSLGTRRTLYLGIPLLAVLDREELLAVVGHELGHFSRRHGALGHRIYRARQGWLAYAGYMDHRSSAFNRGAAAFAHMFVPYFNSYSFIYSRQCEYEADADAAQAAGAGPMARALLRTEISGRIWGEEFGAEIGRLQRDHAAPPADMLERFSAFARGASREGLDERVRRAMEAPSDWLDTHPCLAERLRALGQQAVLPHDVDACAGAGLLGGAWADVTAGFNRKWAAELAGSWALEHARQRHLADLLSLPSDAAEIRGWPVERRLARADLLAAHSPGQAVQELRAILKDHPGHPGASYALGPHTLSTAPDAVALLEHACKQDHGFRVPAYSRLQEHCRLQGDAQTAYSYARRLEKARDKRAIAVYLFAREVDLGQFLPSTLPAGSAALMHEARKEDSCVIKGWLLSRDPAAPPPPPDPYGERNFDAPWLGGHAAVLMVDPEKMQAAGLGEDDVAERYAICLRRLGAPNLIATARVLYSTETFSPDMERGLAALPASMAF
jgi:Zn-dependent protease with chaperone function